MHSARKLFLHSPAARTAAALALLSCFTYPAIAQNQNSDQNGNQDKHDLYFYPNNLVLSRSVYDSVAGNVTLGEVLPPNCPTTAKCGAKSGAIANGLYPYVFNNDTYDGSFGITSRIFLDQLTPWGHTINTLEVPNSLDAGVTSTSNQLVTSFSSKSELALNLSTSGNVLTFMGYVAPVNALDVSNSNTPLVVDPTNPDGAQYYRAAATIDRFGHLTFTETNAYSGNNGRASILDDTNGADVFYTAGNAGNGKGTQPPDILLAAGAQIFSASTLAEALQVPGLPTPVASFNVTQLGDPADKLGKDDNFRGLTIFNNVVYFTKGSGGNGVNTVYFIDTTGNACPTGYGLPSKNAKLPTTPLAYTSAELTTTGLPSNMCILAGFPTALASGTVVSYPFGLWFANDHTLYVADEGDGYTDSTATGLYTHAAAQTTAGLQKWIFDDSSKQWVLAYTLQAGLDLGTPYTIADYPTGTNTTTGLPWAPATDGLRNITGSVSQDNTATIYAVTSTVSGSGDQGADPNRLVVIRDRITDTKAPTSGEHFFTVRGAQNLEVFRGISFTPGSDTSYTNDNDPLRDHGFGFGF